MSVPSSAGTVATIPLPPAGNEVERLTQALHVQLANVPHEAHVAGVLAHPLERLQKFLLIRGKNRAHANDTSITQDDLGFRDARVRLQSNHSIGRIDITSIPRRFSQLVPGSVS